MNKKITSSALAALMIAGSTSFSALAAMSNGTVVIGNKAFDLAYANDPKNAEEITNAIVAGGAVYVKDFEGNWIDNTTGKTVAASVIPAVTYKSADKEIKFDAADKDAVATTFGVTAIGAKKLKVTFASAVDTTKAAISVKKGTVAVNTDSIEFATDKMSATITTTTQLTAGDYIVSVTGLTDAAMTATVTATDEKVSKINVTSPKAPRLAGDNTKALVSYEVLNQYGEKLNQQISWTISTGNAISNENTAKGTFEIKVAGTGEFIPGSVVYITGVHAASGTVVNGQVEIALASQADSVTFKGVYDTTKSKLVDLPAGFADERYVLLLKVNDQYGNAMSTPDLSKLVFTSNNPLFVNSTSFVAATDVTVDNVTYKAVTLTPGNAAKNGGSVTIQAISTITGKISTFTTSASALGSVKSFTMSAPTKIIAETETVEVPFTAIDQYGNAVTSYDLLVDTVKVSPEYATVAGVSSGIRFVKQDDGSAKLKYTAPATGASDKVDLPVYVTSVVTNGGNFSSTMLSVKDAAVPTAIVGVDSAITTSIAKGNIKDIKAQDLIIQDQYGRTVTDTNVNAWLDKSAANSIVVESDDAATTPFTVTLNGGTSDLNKQILATSSDKITLTAVDVKAATEAITFTLAEGNDGTTKLTASTKTITFTKVDQSAYVSFEVADLGTMYNNTSTTSPALDVTASKFDKTVKVYGVKADGTKVLLPAADFTVATNGKLYVNPITRNKISDVTAAGYVAADFLDGTTYKDIKVNVLVTVNDSNGAASSIIEKELLISNKAPKVATIAVNEDEVTDGKAIIKTAKTTNADLNEFIDATELRDQYGVVIAETPVITITGLTKVDGSSFKVEQNGTDATYITGAKMGDKFTATYKYASGQKVVIVFTVGL